MIILDRVSVCGRPGTAPIHDVALRLERGDCVLLCGARGAGKSTLLRCAGGVVDPTRGEVVVEEGPLRDPRILRRHLRRSAMIFSAPPPPGSATVLARLLGSFGGASFPSDSAGFEVLERVDLLSRAHVPLLALSVEELRRFAIARALLSNPEWIFAYEPLETLDPEGAGSILRRLRDLSRRDRIGIVVSTARGDLARESADRLVTLERGRIVHDTRVDAAGAARKEGKMEIHYCSGCGTRLDRADFVRRGAAIVEHKPFCAGCLGSVAARRERARAARRRMPVPR